MKTCSKCGEVQGLGEFHRRAASRDGLSPICKRCAVSKARSWALANPGRRKVIEADRRTRFRSERLAESKARHRNQRQHLAEPYVARCLSQSGFLGEVPPAAIEAKRLQLAIHRLVKEKSK